MTLIKCCVDRRHTEHTTDYAAMPLQYRWPNGSALKVRFLNGADKVRERITRIAQEWSNYANITFDFGDYDDAVIRIAINDGAQYTDPGSWSFLGTYALNINDPDPTMNYGWLTPDTDEQEYRRVVLHEFGHALGLIHEHQNPAADIPWNKQAVYDYYQGPPNNWTKEQIDSNLFQRYSATNTQYTEFDQNSIMLYPIPKAFTTGGFEVGWNREVSQTDIDFVRQIYPFPRMCMDVQVKDKLPDYAAIVTANKWKRGQTLKVKFLDGIESVQRRVIRWAQMWSQYANIRFTFGTEANADIRVSFRQAGSWSYIGTDALNIPAGQPTMNYGWLTPTTPDDEYSRVVLHEFGHALGLIHEHQNPTVNIPWNKPAVYAYYRRTNGWTKQMVDQNLFKTYSRELTQFTKFDSRSIMLYSISKELTVGGFEVGWNRTLSPTDIEFIRQMYPR
jgi:hypothetical protein